MGQLTRTTRSTQAERTAAIELTRKKLVKQTESPKRKVTRAKGGAGGNGVKGGRRTSGETASAAEGAGAARDVDVGGVASGVTKVTKQGGAEARAVVREGQKTRGESKADFRVGMAGGVRPVSRTRTRRV